MVSVSESHPGAVTAPRRGKEIQDHFLATQVPQPDRRATRILQCEIGSRVTDLQARHDFLHFAVRQAENSGQTCACKVQEGLANDWSAGKLLAGVNLMAAR